MNVMKVLNRSRTLALLMCSTALTVSMYVVGHAAPLAASNCCEECEAIDATCAAGCSAPDKCGSDPECLAECYDSCDEWSANCWGVQGQGRYCTWCGGSYTPQNYVCQYYDIGNGWWKLTSLGCWAVGS